MAVEIVLDVSNRKFPSWLKVKENLLTWENEKFWGDLVSGMAGSRTSDVGEVPIPYWISRFGRILYSATCHLWTKGWSVRKVDSQTDVSNIC